MSSLKHLFLNPLLSYSEETLVSQVAEALQYIHAQRLVHGEVKPSYIVIQSCDVRHIYEVRLDGLAVTRCTAVLYSASAIRGNPTYLAP